MKTIRRTCLAILAGACALLTFVGGLAIVKASAAEVPSATTVPTESLEQLSIASGKIVYSTSTGTKTVHYTPSEEEGVDYTLANATDLAIRFKTLHRQTNRPNLGSGLCYIRVKFVGSDTVWGVTKEDMRFTFVDAYTGDVGTIRISNGGDNAIGGQINVSVGTDGTVYIPLTQIRDGNMNAELGNRLTDTDGYQNKEIEYIEFTYSAHRWNFAFGEIALVRQAQETVTTQVLPLAAEAISSGLELKNVWYDNVALEVNGQTATKTQDGNLEVDLGEMGKVSVPSDKLFAYDPIKLTSDLAEGYGITRVATSAEGKDLVQIDEAGDNLASGGYNKNRTALTSGYTHEGWYYLRFGGHGLASNPEDLATLGEAPLNGKISVTVAPLVALTLTGENADKADIYYSRLNTIAKYELATQHGVCGDLPDDNADGKIYLKANEENVVIVVPQAGYDFTGLKLNGTDLTPIETKVNETTSQIEVALYKISLAANGSAEVLGIGEEVELAIDVAEEGGTVTIDGAAVEGTTYATNFFKTLAIDAVAEKGYAATVNAVYAAEEEGGEDTVVAIEAAQDGKYYYQVDGAFTLEVTFEIVEYTITYRLNNGTYANGESNPTTVTYFDTVTLKTVARDGYVFDGWRIEGETELVTQLAEVENDLTLIAVFSLEGAGAPDAPPADPPAEDPVEDGGCGSVVIGGVSAVLLALGAGAVVFARKRK